MMAQPVLIPYAGMDPREILIEADVARQTLNALAPLAMAELFKEGRMKGCCVQHPEARRLIRDILTRANYTWAEIQSPCRNKDLVAARHECIWTVKKSTTFSLPQIGRIFGRDHTTCLFAVRKHEAFLAGVIYTKGQKNA